MSITTMILFHISDLAEIKQVWGVAVVVVALLLWRFWRFTLRPRFHPDDPKELPYWIPWHAWGFLLNSNYVLEQGRKHFPSREIYTITVFRDKICIVTSPTHATEVYRNTANIALPVMARKLYSWNGVFPSSMKTIFAEFSPEKQAMNHRAKNVNDMIQEYHRQQLYPGDNFKTLMIHNVLPKFHASLTWDTMDIFSPITVTSLPADLVTSVAGESEESRAQCEQLTRQLDVLMKGTETCKRFIGVRIFRATSSSADYDLSGPDQAPDESISNDVGSLPDTYDQHRNQSPPDCPPEEYEPAGEAKEVEVVEEQEEILYFPSAFKNIKK
ncbi:hypothetical protein G7Y89_g3925 [Cudoniella acicularis]|uniref:Cytochrome P450 n=1 Tax=Cudoniella acicularis TaxID=354080 RepID=A0A8H4W556_9HELO|nr:hypothetical protein G7Y89_g3925 [Cudoniella acicularis]